MISIQKRNNLSPEQKRAVFDIWNAEYPAHLGHASVESLDKYLDALGDPSHYLALDEDKKVVGWLITFDREEDRWFALLIHRSAQKQGLGSKMLMVVQQNEPVLNGWSVDHNKDIKADGSSYLPTVSFYEKNGFEVISSVRIEKGDVSSVKVRWQKA